MRSLHTQQYADEVLGAVGEGVSKARNLQFFIVGLVGVDFQDVRQEVAGLAK